MSRQEPRQVAQQIQGIPITGLRDASQGPLCGDCTGRLLEGRYPPHGYLCHMCGRVWFAPETIPFKVRCQTCGNVWNEKDGHACPKVPVPRRREAVLATRAKL